MAALPAASPARSVRRGWVLYVVLALLYGVYLGVNR
ncbi:MAG: hypothetical protein JWN58_525, partial [Gammaproteobacteria bacterium]|nr:hypothetical protein [Gammaproteobacteria bacterium]